MTDPAPDPHAYRVLVAGGTERDVAHVAELVAEAAVPVIACNELGDLLGCLREGAGALVAPGEILLHPAVDELLAQIARAPHWSLLPIVLLVRRESGALVRRRAQDALAGRALVALYERPLESWALAGAVRWALAARRTQYEVRDLLAQQQENTSALRRSEELLLEAQRLAALASFQLDLGNRSILRSSNIEAVFGLERPTSEFTLDEVLDRILPEDRETVEAALAEVGGGGGPVVRRFRIHRGGAIRMIEGRARFEAGPAYGAPRAIGTVQDVTEQVEAEERRLALEQRVLLAQKNESLSLLAGGVAHDFNNLLTAVLGQAELALLDLDPAPTPLRRSLEDIRRAAMRAADLAVQMLAYSGRGQVLREKVDLNHLVTDSVRLVWTVATRSADLATRLDPAGPAVEGNPLQLAQVIMNLVTNAAEAMEGRRGEVVISTALETLTADTGPPSAEGARLPPGRYARIDVADDGGGMDAETAGRVFEPFFSTKFTGRGLGLAAVHGIVRGHRGAIAVESTPGRGTTMRVWLPAWTG